MTNEKRAEFLIKGAEERLGELRRSFERGSWNMAIRSAQEVVELSLKSLLKLMNIEYPKEHDVGRMVEKTLVEKEIALDPGLFEKIKRISTHLTEKRAPAFYGEVIYGKGDAEEALDGAEFVFSFAKGLLERLKTREP